MFRYRSAGESFVLDGLRETSDPERLWFGKQPELQLSPALFRPESLGGLCRLAGHTEPVPGCSVDNTIELDTLNRVEQMNWIITPTFSYALTRDLQFSLNGEFVPADTTGRLTLLVAWNLKPKSWLYFVWNEPMLNSRLTSSNRFGVLKLRYLFYF